MQYGKSIDDEDEAHGAIPRLLDDFSTFVEKFVFNKNGLMMEMPAIMII